MPRTLPRMSRTSCRMLSIGVAASVLLAAAAPVRSQTGPRPARAAPESLAPFVPTPQDVVERMLALAGVRPDDIVYDLGSGDGRIPITAATQFGASGVGVDIDPELIALSRENARRAGVADRVEFRLEDAMTTDISEATVVTLYLLSYAHLMLRPRLTSQLKPGARIVSHAYRGVGGDRRPGISMGDWTPAAIEEMRDANGEYHTLYLWIADGTVRP